MGWSMPESSNAWWDDDSHPDARAHREFLAQYGEVGASPSLPRRKASNPAGYITKRDFDHFQEFLGKSICEELAKRDARIAELEARPVGVDYKGVYRKGCSYTRNQAVSHQGSLWIAVKDYPEKEPGEPNSGFRLSVKKGRDGKDAK
jgi:hypothetical protein